MQPNGKRKKTGLAAQLTKLKATMEKWTGILNGFEAYALANDGVIDAIEKTQIAYLKGEIKSVELHIAKVEKKKGLVPVLPVAMPLPTGASGEEPSLILDNDCEKAFEALRAKCLSSPYSEIFGYFDKVDHTNAEDISDIIMSDMTMEVFKKYSFIYEGIRPFYEKVYNCNKSNEYSEVQQYSITYVGTKTIYLARKFGVYSKPEDNFKLKVDGVDLTLDEMKRLKLIAFVYASISPKLKNKEGLESVLLLCSRQEIQNLLSLFDNKSKDSESLVLIITADNKMPEGFRQEEERAVLKALYDKKTILESYLTNDNFCSEQIIEKIVALSALETEIDNLQGKLILLENNNEYKAAGELAEELIVKLNTFAQGFDAAQIEEKELQSRCKEAYDALALFYREKDANIQRLQSKINSYPKLEAVIAYRSLESAYSKDAGRRIMAGCPSKADIEVLNALIHSLEALQSFFAADPDLQENSSFQGISIQEQLDKLKSMQKEALLYETQLADWKERLSEGNVLEPKLFENGRGVLENELPENMVVQAENIVNTEELITNPIAVDEEDDNGNLTSPDDIDQGAVGDCYFLAAVASIASTPNFFYNENNPNEGVIRVVYDTTIEGKVAYFLVRMYLPLTTPSKENPNPKRTEVSVKVLPQFIKFNGRFPFAKPGDQGQLNKMLNDGKGEIWVAILEKAFAEVKGSYKGTSGGIEEEAFGLLLNSSNDQMQRIKLQSSKEIAPLKSGENISDEVAVLEAIRNALNEGRKITVGSKEPTALRSMAEAAFAAEPANEGDSSIRVEENLRIVPGHAYSVESVNGDVVRLRNPHGAGGAAGAIAELTAAKLIRYFDSLLFV